MDLILQIWGGTCYLTNKILFAISEGKVDSKGNKIRIGGWIVYILGVPPWVIILIKHQNWIAASIEAGGLPAMLLGLYVSWCRNRKPKKWVYILVAILTYTSLTIGVGNSVYQHSGITSFSQILEIGVMFGFLLSSYFIAKDNPVGWLFFMLGNISMAALMFMQGKSILMAQQLLSLGFVFYGFKNAINKANQVQRCPIKNPQ